MDADRPFEMAKVRTGIEADLGERVASTLVRAERIGLACTPVQGEHEQ